MLAANVMAWPAKLAELAYLTLKRSLADDSRTLT